MIQSYFMKNIVFSNSEEGFFLYDKSRFGEKSGEKVQYSLPEALYLVEKGKMEIFIGKKKISFKDALNKFSKVDKSIQIKYPVFKDLRERGYLVKSALKFGADFRVYDKGAFPGDEHAKWILFVVHETQKLKWHDFAAKNRVAHSTQKNLLLAIVDEECGISYYEVSWIKP